MSGYGAKNPITKAEMESFRRSLKTGDILLYPETVSREDGLSGAKIMLIKMQVTGIYRNCITLRQGKRERSLTLQEALICNKNRRLPVQPPSRKIPVQERNNKIMDLLYRGMKQVEIAKKMNCSIQTVNDAVREATDKRRNISARHTRIMNLTKKGYSSREIAEMVGCGNATVTRVRKKYAEVSGDENYKCNKFKGRRG